MNQPLGRDYRKGPLQIDWMEFEKNELAGRRQYANAGKKKEGGRGAIQTACGISLNHRADILE